jgi:hypothetical protein
MLHGVSGSLGNFILNIFSHSIFPEIPDVTVPKQLEMLRNWNGELRLLQNFKLKRFNRKSLQHLASCSKNNQEASCSKNNQEELVTDDDIAAMNAVSVETPVAQITESDPQNVGKADISEGAVSLASRKLEGTDDDCMDVGSE